MPVLLIFVAILLYFLYKDIKVFLICIVVFYPTLYLVPNIGSISFISILAYCSLIYCLLFPHKLYMNQGEAFPFKMSFFFFFLSYFFSSLFNTFSLVNLINSTSDYVLIIALWYLLKPNVKISNAFIKVLTFYVILLCSYGAYEALTGNNPVIQGLIDFGRLGNIYTNDNSFRTGFFRTKSLTIWCEAYGIICCCAIFTYLYMFFENNIRSKCLLLVLLVLLFFGIITTNSRTIWVTSVIMSSVILLYAKKRFPLLLTFLLSILVVIFYNLDYFLDSFVNPIMNINDDSGGSSLELRTGQLKISIIATKNIWFGNGINAYSKAQQIYSGLWGVESIWFTTLIDRGILGLISLFVLWCDVIVYVVKTHYFKMLFLFVGYLFTKIATLAYGFSEIYILLFIIVLIRVNKLKRLNNFKTPYFTKSSVKVEK